VAADPWIANDGHGELAPTSIERSPYPCQLPLVNGAQDAGINREQAKLSICSSKKDARWIPALAAYSRRRRYAGASIRRGWVPVNARSASTRACIALRAAFGPRKFALKPSSASNQL
jgi:hypothetical protein